MKDLESRIKAFAKDRNVVIGHLAMLKVGLEKGDDGETIMRNVIASILLRFHGIPVTSSDQN